MNLSKKYKWALIGLAIMVVLNVAILFTLWINSSSYGARMHDRLQNHDRSEMHQSMKNQLGLSEAQSQKIMEIRRSHYSEMRALRTQMDNYRKAYLDIAIVESEASPTQKDSLMNLLTKQYIKIEQSMFTHFTEMREILNPEQQETFKELMRNSFLHQDGQYSGRPNR
jgi:Spy/CpxP family protein refolding chaperone